MRNIKKIVLFFIALLIAVVLSPNFSNAATTRQVNDEEELRQAITDSQSGDVIELSKNIVLTSPIEITGKELTINGNGNTVTRAAEGWNAAGDNGSLITVGGTGSKLTLRNLTLAGAQKYGAQTYNGAYLILDGVTVDNNGFGGILVNAGTLEVRSVNLKRNGQQSNNGIEIAKGNSVSTGDNKPTVIMNGTITSTEEDNVIYIAINDQLTEFEVKNTDTTVDKILTQGNKVVITDPNNNIKYESNESEEITISGETFTENVIVTVYLMEQTVTIPVQPGTTLTREDVEGKIDLTALGMADYKIDGFYADEAFTTEFDFATPITTNVSIYTKLSPIEVAVPEQKDPTPKTGIENELGIAICVIVASVLAIAALKRKER